MNYYDRILNNNNTTVVTSWAGNITVYEQMSSWRFFIKVHVAQSLVFCIVFCRPLSLCIVFFGRCIVCLLSLLITHLVSSNFLKGPSWSWSYGSWIYNYLCNQCLSPLLWVRISIRGGEQHYLIKFVSELRQVSGFLRVLRFPPPMKLVATI